MHAEEGTRCGQSRIHKTLYPLGKVPLPIAQPGWLLLPKHGNIFYQIFKGFVARGIFPGEKPWRE